MDHGGTPDEKGATVPFYVKNVKKQNMIFNAPIDANYLCQVQTFTSELICSLINSFTQMDWPFKEECLEWQGCHFKKARDSETGFYENVHAKHHLPISPECQAIHQTNYVPLVNHSGTAQTPLHIHWDQ